MKTLDCSRLLGFDQVVTPQVPTSPTARAAKVGAKTGVKGLSAKVGSKAGIKAVAR